MQVITLPSTVTAKPTVIALGFFDGCHLGHRALLDATVKLAWEKRCPAAVFTFSDGAVKPGARLLSDFDDRLAQFDACGIDYVFAAPFSALQHLSPEMFVRNVLCRMCGASVAVAGADFRFGDRAAGDADRLKMLMSGEGRAAVILPPVKDGGTPVSASRIRALLEAGETEEANRLLARPYSLSGTVVRGKRLGRKLGFPTANLQTDDARVLPKTGVYVTDVTAEDGTLYRGVTNVGCRPTVKDGAPVNVETHLCGFDGDLYGRRLNVAFLHRLRGEISFGSLDELKEQMAKDKRIAEEYDGNGMDQTDGSL